MRKDSSNPAGEWGASSTHARSFIMNHIYNSSATHRLARSPEGWFDYATRYGLLIYSLAILAGCVSVSVEPLTHESYPPRGSGELVQWLETEPASPHIKLALIIATTQNADEDRLRDKILARAGTMGADAVVLGKSDILESIGPSPLYESTLGPAAASFSPSAGGWGWWNPFYYDTWSFVQSTTDQPERTEYLSGTAIRFLDRK